MSRSLGTSGAGALVAVNGQKDQGRLMSSGKSPVYQIDFSAVACGSRISSTKRKIRWRFGFTNQEALEAGLTGQDCRGEEHDVVLTWSIASGKRLLHVDQQEVHYSNSRSGLFEFSWTMRGNHVLKVVAHASPPLAAPSGFRQYEFFVDGLSFFSFPKVFRLNLANNDRYQYSSSSVLPVAENGGRRNQHDQPTWKLEQPQNEQEEEAILRETMMKSLEENTNKEKKEVKESATPPTFRSTQEQGGDLLDFFSAPAIQQTNSDPGPPENANQFVDGSMSFAGTDSAPYLANQASTTSNTHGTWAQPAHAESQVNPAPEANAYNPNQYAQPAYNPTGYAHTPYNTPSHFALASAPNAPSTSQIVPSYSTTPAPATYVSPSAVPNSYDTPTTTNNPSAPAISVSQPHSFTQPLATEQSSYVPPAPEPSFAAPSAETVVAPASAPALDPTRDPTPAPALASSPTPANVPAPDYVPAPDEPVNYTDAKVSAPTTDQAAIDLNVGSTLADKAYLDIANNFSLSLDEPKEDERVNPFDSPKKTSDPAPTLEGLKTSKPETEKKPVMAPGAIVMSTTQQGNWGSYGQTGVTNPGYDQTQNYGYSNNGQAYGSYGTQQQTPYNNIQPNYSQQQAPYNSMQQQQYIQQQTTHNMQQQQYPQQQTQQYSSQQQTPSYQQYAPGHGQYQQSS